MEEYAVAFEGQLKSLTSDGEGEATIVLSYSPFENVDVSAILRRCSNQKSYYMTIKRSDQEKDFTVVYSKLKTTSKQADVTFKADASNISNVAWLEGSYNKKLYVGLTESE